MLDLNTLRTVLEPLSQIGKDEHTFEVGGHTVTLKPLLPHEEVAVQRYASSFLEEREKEKGGSDEDAGMDRAEALDYFDRFRIEVIAHAICQIDSHDIRDDYILTGEKTDTGQPVRVPRGQAMRELIRSSWSRTMITSTFAQYGELVERLSLEADKIAGRSVADLDVEIERTAERLKQLKKDRAGMAAGDPSISNEQIQNLVSVGNEAEAATAAGADKAREMRERRLRAEARAAEAFNMDDPNTSRASDPPAKVAAAVAAKTNQTKEATPPEASKPEAPNVPFEDVRSSFQDGDDPSVLAEENRIIEARRRAAAAQREELKKGAAEGFAQPAGTVGGVEAYRLPSTELSPRGRVPEVSGQVEVDTKARGEKNPNFKGK